MEPSFRTIANLFQVPDPGDVDVGSTPRKKHGDTADESDDLGRQSLGEGNYEAAIRHFREAVAKREPGDVTSMILLAGALDYSDQMPQALRQYERALRARADVAEPHLGLSDVYRRYGRFRESVQRLEEAVRLEPGNAFHHIKLAETLREMGERKRALTAAIGAVAAQPDEPFYHYWVGDLLIEMGRHEEALDSLRAAIELSPGDDFLYLRAAVAFWRVDRRVEAIKAVRLAGDLDPGKDFIHGLLEALLKADGQLEEAVLEAARATKMDRFDRDMLDRTLVEMGIRS